MSGQMDLEEYQGLVWNYNDRQKDAGGIPEYRGPMPDEDAFTALRMRTAETVARAKLN